MALMIEPSALSDYCDSLLDAGAFTDYAPN
jgi:hypothetical protein